jgi:6-phosphogluconolactonase
VRLIVADDAAHAARLAAAALDRACSGAIDRRGRAVVAVSGGTTPWAMLRAWAAGGAAWRDVHVAQVDERCVAADDPLRNLRPLREILVERGPLPAANLLPMPVEDAGSEGAGRRYARQLAALAGDAHGGVELDLVQLGLGSDGHTASLVPGDAVLEAGDCDAAVTRGEYQGTRRMTLTFRALDAARERLWLVTGESKRAALAELLRGTGTSPAVRVRRDDSTVIADRAAAGDAVSA